MKKFKKAIALLLSLLMLLSVSPVFSLAAEEDDAAAETTTTAQADADTDSGNPFDIIVDFFARIGDLLRIVFEFLINFFAGTGNDAIEKLK